jgi:hypothetical protein
MAAERPSLLVDVEGMRLRSSGVPVQKLSSVIIDMAAHARAPIAPVRFVGGLPRERTISSRRGGGCWRR